MEVGQTIIVNAWGNFGEIVMKCVSINGVPVFGKQYIFDNGMEFYELELLNNFDLWASRAGYRIV